MAKDWTDAYANMAHVKGAEALPAQWAADAAAYRDALGPKIEEIPYRSGERQRLDMIWPDGAPRGLAVFVHGGYWMKFSKSHWTHLAGGARAAGWAVAIPGYTLAPEARIAMITREIRDAVDCAARHVPGPVHLSGHSAGGHLVSRLLCRDLPLGCRDRVAHTLSISGLHDLRPLMKTNLNDTLKLSLEEARAESPALGEPEDGASLTVWVGGAELPEFIRQAHLLHQMWNGFDVTARIRIEDGHNHFSVVEGLRDPQSDITKALLGA